jgi:ankyrin repeat protein
MMASLCPLYYTQAAKEGRTELMECMGELARTYDDPVSVRKSAIETFSDRRCSIWQLSAFAPVLYAACGRSLPNMEMLELLVEKIGVDVNARCLVLKSDSDTLSNSVEGGTALHRLAAADYYWKLDAIKFLVKKGADVNAMNENGETPLHVASFTNTLRQMGSKTDLGPWKHDFVQLLLDLDADPNILDNDGLSCFHKGGSSPEVMQALLRRGAYVTIGKISPLFSAIQAQDLIGLNILLDFGVSPNAKDTTKSFPISHELKTQERHALLCAAVPSLLNRNIADSAPLVKSLIERGADLYAPLNDNETLIHYAFERAEYEIVCAFLDCAHLINSNARDQLGRTVFQASCGSKGVLPGYGYKHWIAKETAPAIRILDHGADPMAVDNDGRNALHHLLDNPDMEQDAVLQFLKNPAAKKLLYQTDRKRWYPLNCAFRALRPSLCEELIDMGADLLELDPTGATALHHIASQYFHAQRQIRIRHDLDEPSLTYHARCLFLWNKFLGLGGDVNARDNRGSPPLFWYLSSKITLDYYEQNMGGCCHVENFGKFFAAADIHARNKDGETALHVVPRRDDGNHPHNGEDHDKTLFEFLIGKGLDPLAEDNRGRSSLDVAAACGKKKQILDLSQYQS